MLTYINGDFVSEEEARISVFDNGFMLGDGVYEIERTYEGRPFRLDDHIERLRRSLRYVELDGDALAERGRARPRWSCWRATRRRCAKPATCGFTRSSPAARAISISAAPTIPASW